MTQHFDYQELQPILKGLLSDCRHGLVNISQFSAFIMQYVPDLNWAGFYFLHGDTLLLGPFQGKIACTHIPIGKGVCGMAASTGKTQLVSDVHRFPGHIVCDPDSNSEIVIPLILNDQCIGVFDIDSPKVGRFSEVDAEGLVPLVDILLSATDLLFNEKLRIL